MMEHKKKVQIIERTEKELQSNAVFINGNYLVSLESVIGMIRYILFHEVEGE